MMKNNISQSTYITCVASVAALLSSLAVLGLSGCEGKRSSTTTPAQSNPPTQATDNSANNSTVATSSKVAEIIGEILGKPPASISPEANLFKDLGADSLDAVEIVMAIEEEFNLAIDDASAEKMQTVGDIVRYINSHKNP